MRTKTTFIGGFSVAAVALGVAITFAGLAHAQDQNHDSHGKTHDYAHAMKKTKMTQSR